MNAPARILPDLSAKDAEIAALKAQLLALQSRPARMTLKVSAKGALCLYGLGRFPITLYVSQWEKVLAAADDIRAFIAANRSALATKPEA